MNIVDSMAWVKPRTFGPHPVPRCLHSSTIIHNKMYVFGGLVDYEWKCINSLSILDIGKSKNDAASHK